MQTNQRPVIANSSERDRQPQDRRSTIRKSSIDNPIVTDFIIAAGIMITRRGDPFAAPNPRAAMFTSAASGAEGDLAQLVRGGEADVVVLAFEPGAEKEGPTNIAVYEKNGGRVTAWTRCFLWLESKEGPGFLVPEDAEVRFSYDGRSIVREDGNPRGTAANGADLASAMLGLMIQCIPPHLRRQIR